MFLYWPCKQYGELIVPLFFVSFHFSFCIVFYNVLGGLIFAHYKQLSETKKAAAEKKKAKAIRKKMKKKKGGGQTRGRQGSVIPEMRLSARFWRDELGKKGTGGDSFFDTATSPAANDSGGDGRGSMGGGGRGSMGYTLARTTSEDASSPETREMRSRARKMQDLYQEHLYVRASAKEEEKEPVVAADPSSRRSLQFAHLNAQQSLSLYPHTQNTANYM